MARKGKRRGAKRTPEIVNPFDSTTINVVDPTVIDNQTPLWCFSRMKSGFELKDIINDRDNCRRLINGIDIRRQYSWKTLLTRNPQTDGIVKCRVKELTGLNPPKAFENESHVYKFYLGGKKGGRVLGFREGRTFVVVWVDFRFEAYKH